MQKFVVEGGGLPNKDSATVKVVGDSPSNEGISDQPTVKVVAEASSVEVTSQAQDEETVIVDDHETSKVG